VCVRAVQVQVRAWTSVQLRLDGEDKEQDGREGDDVNARVRDESQVASHHGEQ
jgi:hypothetical protein